MYLVPDWSKDCRGFLLLQKHCRFCNNAEPQYAPIECKVAAIAWVLGKYRIFIMVWPNVILVIDHQPLTEIFGDRDLSKIHHKWLFKLKEKCCNGISFHPSNNENPVPITLPWHLTSFKHWASYISLINSINKGFPSKYSLMKPDICDY